MRAIAGLICLGLALPVAAQDRRIDIDPNTKIQGGADVRGSSASAGAGAQSNDRIENKPRLEERGNVAEPDKTGPEKDKPVSERKPQETEREDASKGGTKAPQK